MSERTFARLRFEHVKGSTHSVLAASKTIGKAVTNLCSEQRQQSQERTSENCDGEDHRCRLNSGDR